MLGKAQANLCWYFRLHGAEALVNRKLVFQKCFLEK